MGIKWTDLSERQRAMVADPTMPPERSKIDSGAFCEAPKVMGAERTPKLERWEHNVFEKWLILNGYAYRHSRTDKRTRETVGAPDFTVYAKNPYASLYITAKGERIENMRHSTGCCLAIEFKLPGNTLSPAQQAWANRYGGVVHVLASAKEAIELVKKHLRALQNID